MRLRDWDQNLKIRLLGEGMMNFLFWSFFPFMTIYFKGAFGDRTAGLLLIVSQSFVVLANLIGGYCADRFGRKRMMVLAVLGECLAFMLFATANSPFLYSPVMTYLAFGFLGVAQSLYWPASRAMVADVVPKSDRADVFAVFYTALNIAVVAGPLIGSIVFYQYRFATLLTGVFITISLAVLLQVKLEETAPVLKKRRETKVPWYKAIGQELSDYGVIARDRTFLLFIVGGVLVSQAFLQLNVLLAVYTSEVVEEQTLLAVGDWTLTVSGPEAFSLVLAENGLLVALFTVYVTKVMTRFKEKWVFIGSSLLYAVAMTAYGMTESVLVFMLVMGVFTFAELMMVGIQESFVSRVAPEDKRGQYFSASSLRFTLGRLLAPVSLVLTDTFTYSTVFSILGGLSVLSACVFYWMFYRLEQEQGVKA
ncbi:MFS transporter [Pontibacillus halophilus JSM 076056 = DSM 19796]|uniref:MFS transporter n=1 Tax=Pontibacillus halophilus JSM 076056 = DSM 19796 TaxID=1385510 RepID=A0A0A5GMZ5_9BACI|nr:MFS transporter [Pontibacillus halophilus]KGX92598.1 MFS transporter [Pontibacillus halophilus JSM 076056 = DSM 19796]